MDSSLSSLLHGIAEDLFLFGFMLIATLAIVIIIHEFGHYIAARLCGVFVEQFSFGFGKEIWGFGGKKPMTTRWSICAFPIGGFVKLFGDVDPNNPIVWDHDNNCARTLSQSELEYSFCTKPLWQRAMIVAAGPCINFFLFLLILTVTFTVYGQRSHRPIINALSVGTAAHEAGIEIGDIILEMDGTPIQRLSDVYDHTLHETPPQPHTYTILRNGKRIEKSFTARILTYTSKKGVEKEHGQTGMVRLGGMKLSKISYINDIDIAEQPEKARTIIIENFDTPLRIGFKFRESKVDEYIAIFPQEHNEHLRDLDSEKKNKAFFMDPEDEFFIKTSAIVSLQRAMASFQSTIKSSYKLISVAYKGKTEQPVIGGIGRMSEQTAKAVKAGTYDYIMFIAMLSLMIGIINILPIPALDGGYLLFYIYEAIVGKPISPRIQDACLLIGLVFLMGIMIFANINDLLSLILLKE
ncbi:MAG: RIP metalloprotease RseP [Alphaproteobacteria bacterium]